MTSPVQDLLQTLGRRRGLIERAMEGEVQQDAEFTKAALNELLQISALRPAGDDVYRLHPRLREYLNDHLQLFPAFQSLTEIGSRIGQMQALWDEVVLAGNEGDVNHQADMLDSLVNTLFDISDTMGRNLVLLHTRMSTRYGNVSSLRAKQKQNSYYQQQSQALSNDLNRLRKAAIRIEEEASNRKATDDLSLKIRQLILGRTMFWQQGLSEMQSAMLKDMYRTKVIERNLKLLSRMDGLLRSQPALGGFEVDTAGELPDFLMRASLAPMTAHVEPSDSDRLVREELAKLVDSLPAPRAVAKTNAERIVYHLVEDEIPEEPVSPYAVALKDLWIDVAVAGSAGLSLAQWKKGKGTLEHLSEDVWLIFASHAMRSRGAFVKLRNNPPTYGDVFPHTFHDASVYLSEPQGGEHSV